MLELENHVAALQARVRELEAELDSLSGARPAYRPRRLAPRLTSTTHPLARLPKDPHGRQPADHQEPGGLRRRVPPRAARGQPGGRARAPAAGRSLQDDQGIAVRCWRRSASTAPPLREDAEKAADRAAPRQRLVGRGARAVGRPAAGRRRPRSTARRRAATTTSRPSTCWSAWPPPAAPAADAAAASGAHRRGAARGRRPGARPGPR